MNKEKDRKMAEKFKETARVISQESLGGQIYSMWIQTEQIAAAAKPGQFVSVYCKNEAKLLPRPISLCEIDRENGRLRIVYRVTGEATGKEEFSHYQTGVAIMGYRNADTFLDRVLSEHATLYVATEDGSLGTKGNVIDCIRENDLKADVLFACGPTPMLRALKAYAKEAGIECWISMEERMACGIGACLACVCKSTEVDEHSQVKNKRVCKEGPVFLADDVEL